MKIAEVYQQVNFGATPKKEKDMVTQIKKNYFKILQVLPIIARDKKCENSEMQDLLKPCYTNKNYVETEDPLKTRRYYEFIF